MLIQFTPLQARVIGVLLEKEITTPEQYPLSLNALMLGCNQKSSREPIMQLSETDVQNILDELRDKNMLFEHQSSHSRVVKYKHRFCNTEFSDLQFPEQHLALICVMLLRGPQTPGELRTRTNRLADFANVNEVEAVLNQLNDYKGEQLVVKLAREPGKRDSRYAHLFCGTPIAEQSAETVTLGTTNPSRNNIENHADKARISALEEQVATLTKRLDDMQEMIDILSS